MASEAKSVMLAETWDDKTDPTGFWMSEKLDGVRAYWNGTSFYSRQGNIFNAPQWFTKDLPKVTLDGELWCGRGLFQKVVSIVRKKVPLDDEWKCVTYLIFDAPKCKGGFEERLDYLKKTVKNCEYASLVGVKKCQGRDHLRKALNELIEEGGEGLMLRKPGSQYERRRSNNLLKVKTFHDEEALVIDYEYKEGSDKIIRHLECRLPNGQRFSVGTGFSDEQRKNPPKKGSVITFKYFELQESGKPRFPSFLRVREDVTWEDVCENAKKDPPFSQKKKKMGELGKKHSVMWTKVPEGSQDISQMDNAGEAPKKEKKDKTNNNNNNNTEEKKPKEAKPEKPICMYGEKCYRKTEDHLKQFDHPWRNKQSIKSDKQPCKYGEQCKNFKEEHRTKFLHMEAKVEMDGENVVESVFYEEEEEEVVMNPRVNNFNQDNNSDTDEMEENEIEQMKYNSDTDEMGESEVEKMRQCDWADHSTDGSEKEEEEEVKVVVQQKPQKQKEEQKVESEEEAKPDLPLCKYGAGCTRKNPQHFKEYSHAQPKQQQQVAQEEQEEQKPTPKNKKDLMKQQKNDEAYQQLMKKQKIK